MSNVYTTRIFGLHDAPLFSFYTVPGGRRLVIRNLDVYYGGSVTGASYFVLGAAGEAILAGNFGPTISGLQQLQTRAVMLAGEQLELRCDDVMDVTLTGYLFQDP